METLERIKTYKNPRKGQVVESWMVSRSYELDFPAPNGSTQLTVTGDGATADEALRVLELRRADMLKRLGAGR